jgi:hypothetical protein
MDGGTTNRLVYLPFAMVGLNVVRVLFYLPSGEFKMMSVIWAAMYASTIPSAMRGDITPFINIASRSTPWG